jgi:hypothetical protein
LIIQDFFYQSSTSHASHTIIPFSCTHLYFHLLIPHVFLITSLFCLTHSSTTLKMTSLKSEFYLFLFQCPYVPRSKDIWVLLKLHTTWFVSRFVFPRTVWHSSLDKNNDVQLMLRASHGSVTLRTVPSGSANRRGARLTHCTPWLSRAWRVTPLDTVMYHARSAHGLLQPPSSPVTDGSQYYRRTTDTSDRFTWHSV